VLALGTNTDPYQPIEREWRLTRALLHLCLEVGHPVSITTKSARVLDDLPVLRALAARGLAMVMLSVTTLDPTLARRMEPRAATPHRRIEAVRVLAEAGVLTTVSFSPAIPALNCHELEAVAAAAAGAGATSLVAMPLRLPHEVAPLFDAWLAEHYPERRLHVV
jgi:DNA repair photolyase